MMAVMEDAAATARRMWTLFEPVHVVTYFAPEARQAFERAGLRGFWRGYFAGRAAPIGAVAAPPVIAAFGNFAPSFVRRALPAVWELITPAEALSVREAGAVAAIRALLDDSAAQAPLRAAADLLLAATEDLDPAGRPLGAPNAALPVPSEPVARPWARLGSTRTAERAGSLAPVALACAAALPYPNLVSVPRPAADPASARAAP